MNRKPICILVASLFAATPVLAQSDGSIFRGSVAVGGIHVDDDDARDPSKLREYQDLSSGLLTQFEVTGRSGRHWFDAFGENLGRDDQYVTARGGMYDVFKYRLYTDALRHNFLYGGRTPYAGAGSSLQTATFPRLDPNTWNDVDIGYKRRDDGGFFEFQGGSPWYFRVDANQVSWKGTKPGAPSQGMSPGNGFVDLAFPVDYKTRNAGVEGGYNTRTLHFALSWMTSKFENSEELVNWTNGYYGNQLDTTYLAADNKYDRLAGNFTWRGLAWNSVLAARFTMDELTSTVPLGTQVLNSTAGAYAATGPSTPSYQGEVKNDTFSASFSSAPMRRLDTKLYYNYRKRSDESTHVTFSSAAIPGPVHNEPYSYKTNNFGFDVYYRIDRGNRIGGGYDYNDTEREGRFDYDETKDKRLFVEYKNTMLENLAARLKFQRLERDSNFLLGNDGTSTTDVAYWNRYVTAFDLSNVNQDMWKLTLDWSPIPNLDLSLEGIIKTNDFEQNTLGRLKDDRREIYVSASYGLPGSVRFTVFGDSEEIEYESVHRVVGSGTLAGAYEPSTAPNASNYNWGGKVKDRNWAAGIALDWPVMAKLRLNASAIYYKTDGSVDLALQEGVPASVTRPVPLTEFDDTKRTSFNVKAVWDFMRSWSFTGGYAYEKYEYRDQQYDGYRYTVPASSRQDSYLDGVYAFRPYKANIFYGLVTYRF